MSRQGRYGESYFKTLCQDESAKFEAVVNDSKDDMHGWDFIVDIEPKRDARLPNDLQSHLWQCFVQFKTTIGREPKVKIKLSNAVKAAQIPSPFFVFLLQGKGQNKKLFGRHIWQEDIGKSLQRARQMEVSGSLSLNKETITIRMNDWDLITENPVDWMVSQITRHGGKLYALEKSKIENSVGYEETTGLGVFNFSAGVSMADVVAHEIGIVRSIPIERFQYFDERFGIQSRNPIHEFMGGEVQMERSGVPVSLKFRGKPGQLLELPAKAFAPMSVPPSHPDFRLRVQCGPIEIIAGPAEGIGRITCSMNFDARHSLLSHVGLLSLASWSQSSQVSISVESGSIILFSGTLRESLRPSLWVTQLATFSSFALDCIGNDCAKNTLLSLREIYDLAKTLLPVASIIRASDFRFEATFDDPPDEFDRVIGYVAFHIAGLSFLGFYELPLVKRKSSGSLLEFYFSRANCIEKQNSHVPYEQLVRIAADEFGRLRKGVGGRPAVIDSGNLCSLLSESERRGFVVLDI